MTRHSTAFQIERPVPAAKTAPELVPHTPESPPTPPATPKGRLRRSLMAGAALALLAGAAWFGWEYWTVGRFQVATDDAYVKADTTVIAPKVSGYLREVLVGDNESVAAGQVLARIDERDFQVALDQAKADVAAARAAIASKQAQLDTQRTVIDAARATLDVDSATATFAEQENKRYSDLATSGYGSVQNAQHCRSRKSPAPKATRACATPPTSPRPPSRSTCSRPKSCPGRMPSLARTHRRTQSQAELNLELHHDHRRADRRRGRQPYFAHRPVRAGGHAIDVAGAGRAGAYVIANYKETQLTDVHEGQAVEIDGRHVPGPDRCTAMSTAWRPPAARNLHCCRRTTPPAISPRWCSASR